MPACMFPPSQDPLSIPGLISHVGLVPLVDWLRHVIALGVFGVLHRAVGTSGLEKASFMDARLRYRWNRCLEALEYGSGQDYKL